MPKQTFDGTPDPSVASFALSKLGYTPWTAIADIIDNSISAGATKIGVRFQKLIDGTYKVFIADNGCGMSHDELVKAMKYGTERTMARTKLSVYGMGLKTSSTSYTRKFSVVTRDAKGNTNVATWDLDNVQENNNWTFETDEPSPSQIDALSRVAGNGSGTVVIWEKAIFRQKKRDTRRGSRTTEVANKDVVEQTKEYLSLVFHRFLEGTAKDTAKIRIVVDDEPLVPFNPFHVDYLSPDWDPVVDEFTATIDSNSTKRVKYSIRTCLLNGKNDIEKRDGAFAESKQGMKYQGIFPYRADRILHKPGWFDIINFHPDFNSMRIALELDPELDPLLELTVNKDSIDLPEEMYDHLVSVIQPYSVQVRALVKKKRKSRPLTESDKDPHRISNKIIDDISSELGNLDIKRITPNTVEVNTVFGPNEIVAKEVLINSDNKKRKIEVVDTLDDGVFIEPRMRGREHVVYINKSHPFYQKIYVPLFDQPLALEGLDFLLYAMMDAEFATRTDRTKEQFQQMRMRMSMTLRSLAEELPDADEYPNEMDD